MFYTILTVLCLLLGSLWSYGDDAQNKDTKNGTGIQSLRIVDMIHTKIDEVSTISPDRCDADGNIYMRPYSIGYRFGWGQIQKFNLKGENIATFSAQPGYLPAQFFVDGDGTVYVMAVDAKQLAEDKTREVRPFPDIYILRYKKDGTFDRKTRLERTFVPTGAFVVFPTGEILVSGIEAQTGSGKPPSTPFTGLFNDTGELLRRITAKDDDWIDKAVAAGDTTKVAPGKGANPAVARGQALIGSDGNAYLLRRTLPAIVYVISKGGGLVRTLSLTSGEPARFPSIMLENQGQLAIVFQNTGPSEPLLKIFDATTGQEKQVVNVAAQFGAGATCFSPPTKLTFVRVEDGKFVFAVAESR